MKAHMKCLGALNKYIQSIWVWSHNSLFFFSSNLKEFSTWRDLREYMKSNISENFHSISINKASNEDFSLQTYILRFDLFFLYKNLYFLRKIYFLDVYIFILFFMPTYILGFNIWGLKWKEMTISKKKYWKNHWGKKLTKIKECLRRGWEHMPDFFL